MKTFLLSSLLMFATSSAFAKPEVLVLCHSLNGAAKKVALLAIDSGKDDAEPFARITIQGIGAEISSSVPSNDATFAFANDPMKGQFSASGDITSDDGRYTSISYQELPGTVIFAKNSTAENGAADFSAKIGSSLCTISQVRAQTSAQELRCHARWTSKK